MIIVNDIQDAIVVKTKLMSLVRRIHNFNKNRTQIMIELLDIVDDLDRNIERIESQMEEAA